MAVTEARVPRHICIIMDGNGRWAKQRGQLRTWGHNHGLTATRRTIEHCVRRKVEALTLFAFSSENWRRPESEVGLLMDLFTRALQSEVEKLHDNNVRMQFIGDLSPFADKLQQRMAESTALTSGNTGLKLAIAVNYGGRWDITQATQRIAADVVAGRLAVDDVDEARVAQHMTLADCPDPDLFIRTGGERRISNYLLWHLAYTELYFSDALWPDFDRHELDRAIEFFNTRERRFGRTGEQVRQSDA